MDPERTLLKDFLSGGWLIPLLGAAAMLARLLNSGTPLSIKEQIKKIISAAIASGITWFVLKDVEGWDLYKAIAYGIIGVISPEIINGIVKLGKKFEKHPERYIKK